MAKKGEAHHCYTEEERAEIVAHVLVNVACGRFVSRVFREDKTTAEGVKLPNPETFWRWVLEDENLPSGSTDKQGLSNKLVRARESGIEALLDDIIDIADDGRNDTYMHELESGLEVERTDHDVIQRSRLRVETRIKLAQMLKPKKYGPKSEHTIYDGDMAMKAQVQRGAARAEEMARKEREGEEE